MRTIATGLVGLGATLLLAGATARAADISLMAGRVGAVDVPKVAKFYAATFGLKEVNRFEFPTMIEILMNFGDSVDAAKKNTGPQVVIMQRKSDDVQDAIPHLIFHVADMAKTVAALKAAGGKMDADPKPFGKTTTVIGMATDPAGNKIELIQN
ncbi:MAG: VOC family protein [Gammaproteobacteria bacterium]